MILIFKQEDRSINGDIPEGLLGEKAGAVPGKIAGGRLHSKAVISAVPSVPYLPPLLLPCKWFPLEDSIPIHSFPP
jgi:hypothetical protein